ncbi:TolC family protein [Hymenobacter humi]|uniref:TolC family protein n=1 Tax=Hymenobacter humi TaxID=1411620 RepID=A0ABW2U2L3_9BACT
MGDTAGISAATNPTLAVLQQELTVSQQQTKVERLRRLPDIRAGYFNQSINQEGGYQVGQLGLSLPLLGGAQKNRVAAARIGEQVATAQLTYATAQPAGPTAWAAPAAGPRPRLAHLLRENGSAPGPPHARHRRKKLPGRRHRLRDVRGEHRARVANPGCLSRPGRPIQ